MLFSFCTNMHQICGLSAKYFSMENYFSAYSNFWLSFHFGIYKFQLYRVGLKANFKIPSVSLYFFSLKILVFAWYWPMVIWCKNKNINIGISLPTSHKHWSVYSSSIFNPFVSWNGRNRGWLFGQASSESWSKLETP